MCDRLRNIHLNYLRMGLKYAEYEKGTVFEVSFKLKSFFF